MSTSSLHPARLLFTALLIVGLGGCAGSSAVERVASTTDLTVSDAERIMDAYRRRHELSAANAAAQKEPSSLEDVLEALRLDEIDRFPAAVRFAKAEGSPRGKALAAQILIAWGDGQHLLGSLLTRASRDLEEMHQRLERRRAAGPLAAADAERLQRIEKALADLAGLENALRAVGNRHIQEGMQLAQAVIDAAPSDYEGYRVAADYYHQREAWAKFDEMVKKLEALNPSSNGLVFLRAEAARDRDHDPAAANRLFKEALTRDAKFARAQVALLVLQPDLAGAHAELQHLKAINPSHQVVVWVGPTLEREYADWRDLNEHRESQLQDRATPSAP